MNDAIVRRGNLKLEHPAAPQKHRSGETGQALLELALMLPILCLLVVGITDLGRAAAVTLAVNNAATAGVEYGSQNGSTASDLTGMQSHALADTANNNLPGTLTFPSLPSNGCACDINGAGTSCTYPIPTASCSTILDNCATGKIVECVQVVTSMSYDSLLYFPGIPTSYSVTGHAVMRVRQ